MNFGKVACWAASKRVRGVLSLLMALAAAQCSAPMPPLPTRPPADRVVRVAILTPMTGELATFGETVRNGITLAFDEWNDRGGVKGMFIEWVLEDTRCDPLQARQAAERAVREHQVDFIVGGVCSEEAVPIARVADELGVLFVAATATHPLVTVDDQGNTRPLVFRASYDYPYQGRAAARFALNELGARRAGVLNNPGDDFVRSLRDEFRAAFVEGGGQMALAPTDAQSTPQGNQPGSASKDLDGMLAAMAKAAPEVLYVPDAYPVANQIGRLLRAQGLEVALVGSEVWNSGALDLEAMEGAYLTLHYSRDAPNPLAEAWRERYLSAFAIEPDTLSALGYDAANLLATAMEGADDLSARAVARRLENIEYQGVTGDWRFDARHNPLKPVVVARIEEGNIVFNTTVR